MNILKVSLRNAVRRKWKFALVVFLSAVGLAVLTNVYDVAGTVERMEAVILPPGAAPATELEGVVSICLEGMPACAISFAISALGIRRAAFVGLVYYLPSGLVGEVLAGSQAWTSTVAELARTILPFVIFPARAIGDLTAGFESGVAWDWGATGMVVYHFALWTAVAWLGLRRMERRPMKL